ncbi:hypothetical protein FRB99_000076 [Tulasnella sp. 403]|nr:hypothetical protein FRB99_000076 [Tulasnella sp. 403]
MEDKRNTMMTVSSAHSFREPVWDVLNREHPQSKRNSDSISYEDPFEDQYRDQEPIPTPSDQPDVDYDATSHKAPSERARIEGHKTSRLPPGAQPTLIAYAPLPAKRFGTSAANTPEPAPHPTLRPVRREDRLSVPRGGQEDGSSRGREKVASSSAPRPSSTAHLTLSRPAPPRSTARLSKISFRSSKTLPPIPDDPEANPITESPVTVTTAESEDVPQKLFAHHSDTTSPAPAKRLKERKSSRMSLDPNARQLHGWSGLETGNGNKRLSILKTGGAGRSTQRGETTVQWTSAPPSEGTDSKMGGQRSSRYMDSKGKGRYLGTGQRDSRFSDRYRRSVAVESWLPTEWVPSDQDTSPSAGDAGSGGAPSKGDEESKRDALSERESAKLDVLEEEKEEEIVELEDRKSRKASSVKSSTRSAGRPPSHRDSITRSRRPSSIREPSNHGLSPVTHLRHRSSRLEPVAPSPLSQALDLEDIGDIPSEVLEITPRKYDAELLPVSGDEQYEHGAEEEPLEDGLPPSYTTDPSSHDVRIAYTPSPRAVEGGKGGYVRSVSDYGPEKEEEEATHVEDDISDPRRSMLELHFDGVAEEVARGAIPPPSPRPASSIGVRSPSVKPRIEDLSSPRSERHYLRSPIEKKVAPPSQGWARDSMASASSFAIFDQPPPQAVATAPSVKFDRGSPVQRRAPIPRPKAPTPRSSMIIDRLRKQIPRTDSSVKESTSRETLFGQAMTNFGIGMVHSDSSVDTLSFVSPPEPPRPVTPRQVAIAPVEEVEEVVPILQRRYDGPALMAWRSGPMEVQASLYGGHAEEGNTLSAEERVFVCESPLESPLFARFESEVRGTEYEIALGKFAVRTFRTLAVRIADGDGEQQYSKTFDELGGKGLLFTPAYARNINERDLGASLETFWMSFDEVKLTGDRRLLEIVAEYEEESEFAVILYLPPSEDWRTIDVCPVLLSLANVPSLWKRKWKAGHPMPPALLLKEDYLRALEIAE